MNSLKIDNWNVAEEARKLVPSELAIKYRVIPLSVSDTLLTLAVDESFDFEAKETLEFILSRPILTQLSDSNSLSSEIELYYGKFEKKSLARDEYKYSNSSLSSLTDNQEPDVSSESEVFAIINEGIQNGASDIHWESRSQGKELLIRYRIDGELVDRTTLPVLISRSAVKIISHIKLLSHMSIDQKRLPQDGRLPWSYDGKKYDLRVSSLSTIHGESLVMRILDREDMNLDIKELGLSENDLGELRGLLEKPDGLLLVTGPTGSGKTTTLYGSLNFRSQFDDKIITVEDPVEYEFSSFSQIPVSASTGMTFATALRAMLRQSPDTIMIGEIRDTESAQIAVNAALTGHLVMSTLHTNDTLSAVLRLLDLGIQPYQIAAALRGIVAQRLVRKLCPFCKESYMPSEEELSLLDLNCKEAKWCTFYHPKGCEYCQYTGFKGRLALFEILPLGKMLSRLIYDGASYEDLKNHVRHLSITTLKQSGLEKIFKGFTTIEEVVAAIILS